MSSQESSADFAALERELVDLLLKQDALYRAWPKMRQVVARARVSHEIDATERRITEIQSTIATTEAHSLSDVAVQLRRVSARREDGDDMSRTMLASALAVVEAT